MEFKIEVVTIPVTDIEHSKQFYAERMGWNVDLDITFPNGQRLVQLTPEGSGCSIHLNSDSGANPSGPLKGLIIVVDDIEAARSDLVGRGVEASPVRHIENGDWLDGKGGPWNSFVFLDDPDGNGWTLQERPAGH